LGDHVGSKEKIQNAPKIKEFALKALELHPVDATTLHLLGRYVFFWSFRSKATHVKMGQMVLWCRVH
jgi:hypothetical protein